MQVTYAISLPESDVISYHIDWTTFDLTGFEVVHPIVTDHVRFEGMEMHKLLASEVGFAEEWCSQIPPRLRQAQQWEWQWRPVDIEVGTPLTRAPWTQRRIRFRQTIWAEVLFVTAVDVPLEWTGTYFSGMRCPNAPPLLRRYGYLLPLTPATAASHSWLEVWQSPGEGQHSEWVHRKLKTMEDTDVGRMRIFQVIRHATKGRCSQIHREVLTQMHFWGRQVYLDLGETLHKNHIFFSGEDPVLECAASWRNWDLLWGRVEVCALTWAKENLAFADVFGLVITCNRWNLSISWSIDEGLC